MHRRTISQKTGVLLLAGVGCLAGILRPSEADAQKKTNGEKILYAYALQREGAGIPIRMEVDSAPDLVQVTYWNEFGDTEIARFRGDTRMLGADYFDPANTPVAHSAYDYEKKTIDITGQNEAHYTFQKRTMDNCGSLFYVFSKIYPETPGEKMVFFMVQGNLSRIKEPFLRFLILQLIGPVEMYALNQGEEKITVMNRQKTAVKIEMGINEFRSFLWSYKYYFWIDPQNRHILRYQGVGPQGKPDIIEMTDNPKRVNR